MGPVLMSVNPYKWIVGLYAEEAMLSYHGKAAMVEAGELAPHLFGVADHAYSQLVSLYVCPPRPGAGARRLRTPRNTHHS